jgi:uncharacterized 2Fe-2S/4Fe-4S cluster protein (DUF4445 family)
MHQKSRLVKCALCPLLFTAAPDHPVPRWLLDRAPIPCYPSLHDSSSLLGASLHRTLDFEPVGRRVPCPEDSSLLDSGRHLGVDLVALCGGEGTCGRCRVRLMEGQLSLPTPVEREVLSSSELQDGWRLACQAYPRSDARLFVPPESLSTPQRTQLEGLEVHVPPDPAVRSYPIRVPPPSLEDLRADADRMFCSIDQQHGVPCTHIDLCAAQQLSTRLRSLDWQVEASLRCSECIAVRSTQRPQLGLAVDLGTTKMAAYLIDLPTGRTLASQGMMNPQIAYGEDVVTRIMHALQSEEEARTMQALAVDAISALASDLSVQIGATLHDILDAVVVGNTAMHHLLLRLPVQQLVMSPYIPALSSASDIKAREIGLHLAPGAYLHLLPNIAGYVGADHVAMILGTELWKASGIVLALDIGTNTEICLALHGKLSCVSCASGPAFEGAHITHGMRAAAGAIERLRIVDERVEYQTVGNAPPVGLCGSGIVDALGELHRTGVLDHSGRMLDHPRVRIQDGQREFVLVDAQDSVIPTAVTISQRDVRELQLAKGAMRTGIEALLQCGGLGSDDIDQVIIAGAFGSYLDVSSAMTIGMLPSLPVGRFRQVGNAAGTGARLALMSREQRARAREIAQCVRYIELASLPSFPSLFSRSMYLGEYRISLD